MITITLILAAAAVAALIAAFTAVVLGIQLSERRKSLPGTSRGCADAFARRVLQAEIRRSQAGWRCSRGAPVSRGRRVAGHVR